MILTTFFFANLTVASLFLAKPDQSNREQLDLLDKNYANASNDDNRHVSWSNCHAQNKIKNPRSDVVTTKKLITIISFQIP